MNNSQLVKVGENLLKKGTSKNTQVFKPYQNQPFCGPLHNNNPKKKGGGAPIFVTGLVLQVLVVVLFFFTPQPLRREKVCSGTARCRKLILGRDIG